MHDVVLRILRCSTPWPTAWLNTAVALGLLLGTASPAHAAPTAVACPVGYTVAFFNGVGNTYVDALAGTAALKAAQGFDAKPSYNGENVSHVAMYNHTGTSTGGPLQDVAEVFIQRANELDPSGQMGYRNFFLLWEMTGGGFDPARTGYSNTVATSIPGAQTLLDSVQNTFASIQLNALSLVLSNPPTLADYAEQRASLDEQVRLGHKLLLVAHSQGNLFVNQAYDYVQPAVGTNAVKVVHVAPASPTLRGKWILTSNDVVINGLRLKEGAASVPDVTLQMDFSTADPSGHELVGTYLDRRRAAFPILKGLMDDALVAMPLKQCSLAFTPANVTDARAGQTYTLTAQLANDPVDSYALVRYQWQVAGNAGGLLRDPVTGSAATSFETTSKTVTYVASSNALNALKDTVTVTVYLSHLVETATHNTLTAPTSMEVDFGTVVTTVTPLALSPQVVTYPRVAYYIGGEPRFEYVVFYVQAFPTQPSVTRYEILEQGRTTPIVLTQARVNTGAPVFDSYDNYLAGYSSSLVNMGNGMAAYVSIALVSGGPPSADAINLATARGPEFAVTVNAVTVTP